jgi:C-terminal processing protease CtpA/Prc
LGQAACSFNLIIEILLIHRAYRFRSVLVRVWQHVREDLDRFDLGEMPIVVLVNGYTMAEAEAVAAALQESGRAVVMGTETLGQGATYSFVELADGSAIYIPTLRWYTPSGKPLSGNGVQPDVQVVFQRETEGFGGETQFNRAYDYLDAQLPPFR